MPGAHNLVAVVDGRPAGMASGVPVDQAEGFVELISMWVSPAARGKGVGDCLIREVARWAAERGATSLRLSVMPDNKRAAALYERHGFTDTGVPGDLLPDGTGRERALAKDLMNSWTRSTQRSSLPIHTSAYGLSSTVL
ncbi:GNAT family N-acetyltransferase [Streptomyces sp. NPDC001407]|uniref:GNAT family N-acetyltransferase n=1 Tax=Streptomyces sp. NPDC001407 TaxID=3364573 RepID=UPI003692D6D4